ncbi:hypothetical protein SCHPADRAFT_996065 [Schizopora paradoxa]|uniref:Transmembrane protein n=1 Tax=Schizopora paradoxa TaxID=27342 RepID=A0A0H2SDL7_9AGAM|nr:hypothetical protein SCHPADRAFT_996065 [Schizopora paradoxa]
MILIDELIDEKEETTSDSDVSVNLPVSPTEPLLPIAIDYGTFESARKTPSTRRYLLKAFFVAWAIWIAILCIVFAFKDFLKDDTKPGNVKDGVGRAPYQSKPARPPIIDDNRITTPSCVFATPISSEDPFRESIIFMDQDRPNRAAAKFGIPATSDLVHFFNNGSINRAFGFIRITASEERRPDIQVDVTVSYENEDALKTAKICLVEETPGEVGVGIVLPTFDLPWKDPGGSKQVRFDFDVTLPAPLDETESVLFLKKLKTNFTVVHHRIDDLYNRVNFESVSLQTSYMPISFAGLAAEEIDIQSRDSLLVGLVNATKSVDMRTSNSPISVQVALTNNNTQHPSRVSLKTINSPIDAVFRFYSTNSHHNGLFLADVETENAHVGVYNDLLPLHSNLTMKVRTSKAPVTIQAPPEFEGTFLFSEAPFIEPRHVEDPEGRGRTRRIPIHPDRTAGSSAVGGAVYWEDSQDDASELPRRLNSSIEVETTVNPISFKLYHTAG